MKTHRILTITIFLLLCLIRTAWPQSHVSVTVKGVAGALHDTILGNISLEQEKNSPLLTERYILFLYSTSTEEIKQALKASGYYHPKIDATLTKVKNRYYAAFTIKPGIPTLIAISDFTITGDGAGEYFFTEYNLPFGTGDIFVYTTYEKAKSSLLRTARENGYFDARFTRHHVLVEPDINLCTVSLDFETGRRYFIGSITVQQDVLSPSFVDRFIFIKPGMPYNAGRMLDLRKNFNDSGYFSSVDINLKDELVQDYHVPVDIILTPLKKHRFSAGMGYGTDTGPRGSLGWENRRINRHGHRFKSKFNISSIRTGISGIYEIPLRKPLTEQISFQSGWQKEITDTSESISFTFRPQYRKNLGKGWIGALFIDYLDEFFTIGKTETHTRLIIPGIHFSRTLARNFVYPVRGSTIGLEYKATDPALGSDIGFSKISGKAKIIRTLFWEHRILLRGESGYIDASKFDRVPASLRYLTGGDNSVRGYAYQSLGPADDTGEVIGGQYLVVGSVEYEYKISEKWRGAFFYDAGNAFVDIKDDFNKAWGTGIRWRSPVGPIRFDIAFPITDPNKDFRIHINMEPDL